MSEVDEDALHLEELSELESGLWMKKFPVGSDIFFKGILGKVFAHVGKETIQIEIENGMKHRIVWEKRHELHVVVDWNPKRGQNVKMRKKNESQWIEGYIEREDPFECRANDPFIEGLDWFDVRPLAPWVNLKIQLMERFPNPAFRGGV